MRVGVNALFLLPGEVGGSEFYLRELLPAMQRASPSLEIVVFTNRENHDSFSAYERVPMHVAAVSRPRRIFAEQAALPKVAKRHGVDLMFSPGYTAPLYCALPRVTTLFDVQFRAFPGEFSALQQLAHRVLVTGAARSADRILTVSQFSAGEIHKHLAIPLHKITVTPPGLPRLPDGGELPHGIASPYLLYVSDTYPHKNIPRLAEAFLRIADRIPHTLIIVGKNRGGEPPACPRIVRKKGLAREALSALFQHCDAFVNPSLYEGFGFSTLEAMASGARVVAASTGAIHEVAADVATYFEPLDTQDMSNTIMAVLNESRDVRETHIEKGLSRAETFSWDNCACQTLETFQEAVHARRQNTS